MGGSPPRPANSSARPGGWRPRARLGTIAVKGPAEPIEAGGTVRLGSRASHGRPWWPPIEPARGPRRGEPLNAGESARLGGPRGLRRAPTSRGHTPHAPRPSTDGCPVRSSGATRGPGGSGPCRGARFGQSSKPWESPREHYPVYQSRRSVPDKINPVGCRLRVAFCRSSPRHHVGADSLLATPSRGRNGQGCLHSAGPPLEGRCRPSTCTRSEAVRCRTVRAIHAYSRMFSRWNVCGSIRSSTADFIVPALRASIPVR